MQAEYPAIAQLLQTYATSAALVFTNEGILMDTAAHTLLLPFKATVDAVQLTIQAVHLDGTTIIVKGQASYTADQLSSLGFQVYSIRASLVQVDESTQYLILRAYHWLNWDGQARYCGGCGYPLISQFDAIVKHCRQCGQQVFPRFSPAIMVLITREDEVLLARSAHFSPGVYSAIAGFIEMGETAEQAVHREVREELGFSITNLTYFHSQSWPFPDSFMIAFTADYLAGKLVIDTNELEDAQWFRLNQLPELPIQSSIARRLIESVSFPRQIC